MHLVRELYKNKSPFYCIRDRFGIQCKCNIYTDQEGIIDALS